MVDYVISGSGAKLDDEQFTAGDENIKRKGAKNKFLNKVNGFAGFEIENDMIKVTYVDKDGKELYSFSKRNPRATTVIG